jgi:hypothetical protein
MKNLNQWVMTTAVAVVLGLGATNVSAQQGGRGGRGNFDPEQFRQQMMDRYKERLEVKSDDEWKIISERIEKVTQAQRDVRIGGFGGPGGPGGRRGGPPDAAQNDSGGRTNRNRFNAEPSPEVEALQKALDSKGSSDEIKAKLAKVRSSLKEKEAKLAKAQDDLREVLSVRQEATAVLIGLLK